MHCLLCPDDMVEEQLTCSSCNHQLHYSCGMGVKVPPEDFRTSPDKQQYICPICIAATSYNRIHLVLARHEEMSKLEPYTPVLNTTVIPVAASSETHGDGDDVVDDEEDESLPSHISVASNVTAVPIVSQRQGPNSHTVPHPPPVESFRVRRSTANSNDTGFRDIVSNSEKRRIKRCKGMLYGLKHMGKDVETLLVLDSNGRSIKSEDIDGSGENVRVSAIGGLCVAAATSALNDCSRNLKFPKIKRVAYGLGTNDHLHAHEHPGQKVQYIKQLNEASKKVFPNARVQFILPFADIEGLGADYVRDLSSSIVDAHVGWKIHHPPSMKQKLVRPARIHLNPLGRVNFTQWLRKIFAPRRPTPVSAPVSAPPSATAALPSILPSALPSLPIVPQPSSLSYAAAANGAAKSCAGESNIDSLLKERLFALLLGSHSSHGHQMSRQGCCNY